MNFAKAARRIFPKKMLVTPTKPAESGACGLRENGKELPAYYERGSRSVTIIIKTKDTDNIIGLKEEISARLEGVAEIMRIDVEEDKPDDR